MARTTDFVRARCLVRFVPNSRPHPFVSLTPAARLPCCWAGATIRVNSLHGRGILEPGERVVIEGVAEDGTIEAIRIADAPSFALGCNGTRNMIRSAIRSTGRCFRRSAQR